MMFEWFFALLSRLRFWRREKDVIAIAKDMLRINGRWISRITGRANRTIPYITFKMSDEKDLIAYTSGTTIVFGSVYMNNVSEEEIKGVAVHEIAHAIQRAPKYEGEFIWMIEGIADFARYSTGYGTLEKGDPREGYKKAARFFLWLWEEYIERYNGIVDALNRGYKHHLLDDYVNRYLSDVLRYENL